MNHELKFPLDKPSFISTWIACLGVQSSLEREFVVVVAALIDMAYRCGYNDGQASA